MTITEKVAYLRGLCEGMGMDEKTNEGRIFKAIIDVLEDMAFSIVDVEDAVEDMSEQLEGMDEDIEMIAEDLYGEDDDDDEDEEIYEVTCPSCGEELCLDYDAIVDGSIDCPSCGELLEFDFDECDCGCDCKDCGTEKGE